MAERLIGDESGFISARPSGAARSESLRIAKGIEAGQIGGAAQEARIQIAQQFEAYRASGGIPELFQVSSSLRQTAEVAPAPGSGGSPGNYLLPHSRPFAPQAASVIGQSGEDDAGTDGVHMTVIL